MNIEIIPNWHPILVHFTIALFTISSLLYLVGMRLKNPNLLIVARWNLWIGALVTIMTIFTGFNAYNSITHDGPLHAAMTNHQKWALVTASLFSMISIWAFIKHRGATKVSPIFVIIILSASVLLAITGYKGGEVVYLHGGGVMRMPIILGGGGHGSHAHPDGGHGEVSQKAVQCSNHDNYDSHHNNTQKEDPAVSGHNNTPHKH
ncbi:MAG: DUF2231 domain-containing protein [Candidatus Endonucleobacter bathymodioli]|uniref:DUF2231 domain-containing protein n=1 Tax=Candidatus Endonucleibacter bathymodioli TaxID=539814 RepID=A0AA90SSY3_9GAMM|nr:DUF2231 domain-containing protein [Candidatus Endonucleobacter bathymodioli]